MAPEIAEGAVIAGRYRIDRRLGQGGMGEVWAATHLVTRKTVALKVLRGAADASPALRRRFLREGRAATAVAHPNVVDVLDVLEIEGETPVIVMELLDGETLGGRLAREGSLSLAVTAELLVPVISAVRAAHTAGVIHRDLKPENIFLTARAGGEVEVKVLDFGIAKMIGGEPGEALATTLTEGGAMIGTPCYMAPEQACGERDIDARADVWALGVILYECLGGCRPIEGDNLGQVVKNILTEGITPLDRLAPDLPPEVAALVMRMLARDRSARPSDLAEVATLLQRFADRALPEPLPRAAPLGSSTAPALLPTVAAPLPAKERPRRTTLALVAALGLLGVIAAVRSGVADRAAAASGSIPTDAPPPVSAPAPAVAAPPPSSTTALAEVAPAASASADPGASALPPRSSAPSPPRAPSAARSASSPKPAPSAASTSPPSRPGGLVDEPPY
ncbi:MAG: serine/threonine-protein kinase [Byssovorax sp.]